MFLMSDAFRALEAEGRGGSGWESTTILLVSWDWGPDNGPEALASRRLVAPLLDAGARVHVLAATAHVETLRHDRFEVSVVPHSSISDHKLTRTWQMARRGVPEATGLWVADAVSAGIRVLSSLPADTVIYGRAMPGTSNIVAWHLARRTGLPWIAHFSDPWPPVQMRSQRWNLLAAYKWPLFQFWRRRIIEHAGALTFTNPCQAAVVLGRRRQQHVHKAFVVAHLPTDPYREPLPQQTDLFHIVHTGNFYSLRGHNASTFVQGLRRFLDRTPAARGRVRFTQAGWHNGDLPEWTTRCGLDDVVRMLGRVSQTEVSELLDAASLLLAVDYAMPDSPIVVSKLPDYITARRPILALTAPGSAMGRLFAEDHVGLTAHYASPEEVAGCIDKVFGAWSQRRFEAFLPQAPATESFTQRRALAELAGAFAVARRRHALANCRVTGALPLLGEGTAP